MDEIRMGALPFFLSSDEHLFPRTTTTGISNGDEKAAAFLERQTRLELGFCGSTDYTPEFRRMLQVPSREPVPKVNIRFSLCSHCRPEVVHCRAKYGPTRQPLATFVQTRS